MYGSYVDLPRPSGGIKGGNRLGAAYSTAKSGTSRELKAELHTIFSQPVVARTCKTLPQRYTAAHENPPICSIYSCLLAAATHRPRENGGASRIRQLAAG